MMLAGKNVLIAILLMSGTIMGIENRRPSRTASPRPEIKSEPAPSTPEPIASNLEYQTVIGDKSPEETLVVLAVGYVTVFYTPEVAYQWHCGQRDKLEFISSDEGAEQTAIYLRPTMAFSTTNFVLEMPGGTVSFLIKAVDIPGGARTGQFHGDVFVRPRFYQNELKRLKTQALDASDKLKTSGEKLASALNRIKELEDHNHSAWDEGLREGRESLQHDALRAMEISQRLLKSPQSFEIEKVKLTQISEFYKGQTGYWVLLKIENTADSIRKLETVQGEGDKYVFAGEPYKEIGPKTRRVIAVYIEKSDTSPRAITLSVNGKHKVIPLTIGRG
jgi:hypothetical protein